MAEAFLKMLSGGQLVPTRASLNRYVAGRISGWFVVEMVVVHV